MTVMHLGTQATSKFNAEGFARAIIGPQKFGTTWNVKRIVTNADSKCELRVYRNSESPNALLDATYSGEQDINETDITLATLESLVFVWSKGISGQNAIGIITGTQDDGRG